MALSKDDRIIFSLEIVSADSEVKGIEAAKASLMEQIAKIQKLDNANKNLYDPVNVLTNRYQDEIKLLDGIVRTTIVEQDLVDSAIGILRNHFFPNDINVNVPSLAPYFNVWSKVKPFALTYSIGKNYTEGYDGSVTKEGDLINAVLAIINAPNAFVEIEKVTGLKCESTGTCSLPLYLDQASCEAATPTPGIWTPGPDIFPTYPEVHTLKTNLVTAVNNLKAFLVAEEPVIVNDDKDATRQATNNAARNDILNVIIPALDQWLNYPDFNTNHGQTTCTGFYTMDPNTLAPTKLHDAQLAFLVSALNTRLSYITTRVGQLTNILGSITQNLSTGDITASSGLYGRRYAFMSLRLNALDGSLVELKNTQGATNAQDGIKDNILATKAIYLEILPTSSFKSAGNGTATVHLIDASLFNPGDTVYIVAEGQEELVRAVKSKNGNTLVLNDIVPAKYRTIDKARLYKDIS